jgi:hypothetical protein
VIPVPFPTDGIIHRSDDQSPAAFLSVGDDTPNSSFYLNPPRSQGNIQVDFRNYFTSETIFNMASKALAVIAGVGPGTVCFHDI